MLYEDEDGFRYYRYDGDIPEEEYDELVTWLRGHSDYDTEIVPEYEDQILMLSTCSYHTKNGRFVLAARRVVPIDDQTLRVHAGCLAEKRGSAK